MKIEDQANTTTTIRAMEIQAHRGTNTLGENTAVSAYGRTFGVRAVTQGDAGGAYLPAALFAQTRGTTQGNAVRAFSDTITSADLVYLYQDTSTFTGDALRMNMAVGSGNFTGNLMRLQVNGSTKFKVEYNGTTTIGNGVDQAGLQIGLGGLCVDDDGSCSASTTGRISGVEGRWMESDLAENYFSDEFIEAGEIVATAGKTKITKAGQENENAIIGIVSTKPGLVIGEDDKPSASSTYPVALSGRVPIKVSTEGGEIKIGDKIMLSSIDGIGMAANRSGLIVGTALESFDGVSAYSEGVEEVMKDNLPRKPKANPEMLSDEEGEKSGCYYGAGEELGGKKCDKPLAGPAEIEDFEPAEEQIIQIENPLAEEQIASSTSVKIGKILVFVNLGWYKLDHNIAKIATGEAPYYSVDPSTGRIAIDFFEDINLQGNGILNIGRISGIADNWSISEEGILTIKEIKAKKGTFEESLEIGTEQKPTGITIYDTATGEPYCMQMTNGAMQSTPGKCSDISGSSSSEPESSGASGQTYVPPVEEPTNPAPSEEPPAEETPSVPVENPSSEPSVEEAPVAEVPIAEPPSEPVSEQPATTEPAPSAAEAPAE